MAHDDVPVTAQSNLGLFVEPDVLRRSLEVLVRAVLEEEVERFLGAKRYERVPGRRGQRNGTKPRTMKSSVGVLRFDVPQVRVNGFHTSVFDRYQRSDRALVLAIREMYVQGVSTRKVSAVMEQLGGFEVSAATVSRETSKLDEQVQQWRSRALGDKRFPYLTVDARYEKVRNALGHVVSQAVFVAAGINEHGRRELLGIWTGNSESEATWGEVFRDLLDRGLRGVEVLVSDAHRGILSAMSRHLQGCRWQRCKVHWMREAVRQVGSWRHEKKLAKELGQIFVRPTREQCLLAAQGAAQRWRRSSPSLANWIEETVEDCLSVCELAPPIRQRLSSTNMLERLMREFKRRSRVVSIFPNEASLVRLMGSLAMEFNDAWACEKATYIPPSVLEAVEMPS